MTEHHTDGHMKSQMEQPAAIDGGGQLPAERSVTRTATRVVLAILAIVLLMAILHFSQNGVSLH